MKKQIFSAVVAIAAVAAMSVSAIAVDAGFSDGSFSSVDVKVDAGEAVDQVIDEGEVTLSITADEGVFADGLDSFEIAASNEIDAKVEAEVEKAVVDAFDGGNVVFAAGEAPFRFEVKSVDVALDISAILDGKKVQPDGSVEITISRGEGMETANQAIYIGDDGKVEVLPTTSSKTEITFKTTHFSTFYLVTAEAIPNGEDNKDNPGTGVVLAVIPAVAAAAAIVVSKKRK